MAGLEDMIRNAAPGGLGKPLMLTLLGNSRRAGRPRLRKNRLVLN
jgi:hypothetical protein